MAIKYVTDDIWREPHVSPGDHLRLTVTFTGQCARMDTPGWVRVTPWWRRVLNRLPLVRHREETWEKVC